MRQTEIGCGRPGFRLESVASVGPVIFSESDSPEMGELVDLYDSVSWAAYTHDRETLALAVANSTYLITARSDTQLVGLARGLSDGVSIFYLQDLLVRPDHQGKGVGRELMEMSIAKHANVRQIVLMTDDDHHVHKFYRSLGFKPFPTNDGLHGFVKIASSS